MERIVKKILIGLRERDLNNLSWLEERTGMSIAHIMRRGVEELVQQIRKHDETFGNRK